MAISPIDLQPLLLNVSGIALYVTPEQFDRLSQTNRDLRLELTKDGELIIMPPTGGESGKKSGHLFARVWNWNDKTKLGDAFDSSTGYDFTPQGGGKMSPDVSWIEKSRLEGVDIVGFIPVVPDFALELRSATDRLSDLHGKMWEYRRLGVKLGLLINPQERQVEIYRPTGEVEILKSPLSVDCFNVMPEFVLSMTDIW
ncbi:Uma2 family endonuclease [Gloeocapsa sp. PCC 73106]|uniref:Uma2 family endonuclease n=1 Tax=Gloeocapsa sp. PCC 73106 TaxID=102232 RepID=UPI0002AC5911|nr:Uma2 family endonuclease [Gloeocapsa sp. PCC 73106]ELR98297.1 hypothetical protein GLO73106DRAFT_00021250 [Gloeocapsa sp. PCC 73106]